MLRAEELTPGDLLQVLWRQRYALVGCALVGAALAYGYSLFVPDRYTAETLVLVEDAELPRDYVQSTSTMSLRARLNTLSEHVLSRTRLESLVDEYELAGPGKSRADAVASVRRRVAIDVLDTDGFRLSFTDEDPRMAARIANALADFFIAESTGALRRQVQHTASGIQQQVDDLQEQLDAKEAEIGDFKSANMGTLPDQLGGNMSMLRTLQQQLRANASELATARTTLAGMPPVGLPDVEPAETISAREAARRVLAAADSPDELAASLTSVHPLVRLEARLLQREALLRRYTERHPDVLLIDAEIAAAREALASAPTYRPETVSAGSVATPDASRATAEARVRQLERERDQLVTDIGDYQARVDRAPAVERRLRELERDRDVLLSNYNELTSRNLEADLSNDLQAGDSGFQSFRVIDPAVVPENPSSPLRVIFLLAGGILGAGLVIGAALLRELLVEPVNSGAELERFADFAVLASIPQIRTRRIVRRERLLRLGALTGVGSVLVVVFLLRIMMRG